MRPSVTSLEEEAEALAEVCRQRSFSLVTAESCTGGLLGGLLTALPGISDLYWGGWIVYSNHLKEKLLGVDPSLLESCGAVSREVLAEMLQGALRESGADAALAVTGIAGPGGGTPEKPVGTVWLGIGLRGRESCLEHRLFQGNRQQNRYETVREVVALAERAFRKC